MHQSNSPQCLHVLSSTEQPSAPVNLTAHWHNDSTLILQWDPPHDRGGRPEVMYSIKCLEKVGQAGGVWTACGEEVVFLPASLWPTNTTAGVTGLNPHRDYQMSVNAWNALAIHQGASASSTATVTIHRCMFLCLAMAT